MTRQDTPHRMSLPPPSAISFGSKVVLTIIAIVLAGVVVASAPRTVILSSGVALGGVLIVSGILAAIARSRPVRMGPAPAPVGSGEANDMPHNDISHDEAPRPETDGSGAPTRELAWLTLGLGSMAILTIAVVVPDDVGAVLAAIAFTGLAIFRVSVGWAFRVPRDGQSDDPHGRSRQIPRANSYAVTAGPSGSSTPLATP